MRKNKKLSYYDVLGISQNATFDEIKQAYLDRMADLEGIVNSLNDNDDIKKAQAKQLIDYINEAYRVLSDDDLRADYDKNLNMQTGLDNIFSVNKSNNNNDTNDSDLSDTSLYNPLVSSSSKRSSFKGENSVIAKRDDHMNDTYDDDNYVYIGNDFFNNLINDDNSFDDNSLDSNEDPIRVTNVEEGPKAKKLSKWAIALIAAASVISLIAIIYTTASLCSAFANSKKNKDKDKNDELTIITSASVTDETTIPSLDEEPVVDNAIVNFGDATDPKVVSEKVDALSELVNSLDIINPQTREAYDKEDLKDIVLFMNAALIPDDEEHAYSMVDRQLDLTAELLSTPRVINFVNHMAGNEMFTDEMIEEDIKNGKDLCLVDSILLGDSYCYPYLQYLEDSYNELLRTKDKEKFIQKYNNVIHSLAEIVYGKGYSIDNKNFIIADFSSLGDINDGNLLVTYANLLSVLNVDGVQQFVTVTGRDGKDVTVSVEELFSNFDLVCVTDELDIDDEGKIIGNVENFHQRVQVNTINAAVENKYHDNLNAYEDNYNKSLGR